MVWGLQLSVGKTMDRRRYPRFESFLSVQIDAPDKPGRVGVSHNVSATGMLLTTPSRFRQGQTLSLTVTDHHGGQRRLRGHVTRLSVSTEHVFSRRLGIAFDDADIQAPHLTAG